MYKNLFKLFVVRLKFLFNLLPVIYFLSCLSSCMSSKEAISFNVNQDIASALSNANTEYQIRPNDILSIVVSSKSELQSQIFNQPNSAAAPGLNSTTGYLVDEKGTIQFPVIGSLKIDGLTKSELEDTLTKLLNEQKLLLDPIVSVRNLNFKVTVLGEVLKPGVINVPSEKINILEAVGSAGDMTLFANRKKVLLIREERNERTFKLLNFNNMDIFSSPYYYLKPNDIIYVEPNKTKISNASAMRQWLPIIFSALSLATIAIYRIGNN